MTAHLRFVVGEPGEDLEIIPRERRGPDAEDVAHGGLRQLDGLSAVQPDLVLQRDDAQPQLLHQLRERGRSSAEPLDLALTRVG